MSDRSSARTGGTGRGNSASSWDDARWAPVLMMMKMNATSTRNSVLHTDAAKGLALVRVTIGAMFVWVFFENLGKGLYTPAGYAGLIGYYVKSSHCPAVWKSVMALAASHAAIAAPLQGLTEISLGVL